MYAPDHFKENDVPTMQAAIHGAGIATLVTVNSNRPQANHVPMLLVAQEGAYGTLYGHVARANPLSTDTTSGSALAIFLGPESYISPSWYPTKADTGKVVPTWNYVAVHATAPITFFDDRERLLDLVNNLTERHERVRKSPWAVSDAPSDYIDSALRAIVGFRLSITTLEGKWKMSQNRIKRDQQGVVSGLKAEGAEVVANIMKSVTEKNNLR